MPVKVCAASRHGVGPKLTVALNTEADASGASLPSSMSVKAKVWSFGPILIGGSEESARKLLGKLMKAHGEQIVADVLEACAEEQPGEPKAWITAACIRRSAATNGKHDAVALLDPKPQWALQAGFPNRYEAENAGCKPNTAHLFREGQRATA
jgi:hypothetical protein